MLEYLIKLRFIEFPLSRTPFDRISIALSRHSIEFKLVENIFQMLP